MVLFAVQQLLDCIFYKGDKKEKTEKISIFFVITI